MHPGRKEILFMCAAKDVAAELTIVLITLVVAEVRQRLSVRKWEMFNMETFDLKKVNNVGLENNHDHIVVNYIRSIVTSEAFLPQSAIWCFLFQFPISLLSLMSSSSHSYLLPHLLVTCVFPSVTCCVRQSYTRCAQSSQLSFFL